MTKQLSGFDKLHWFSATDKSTLSSFQNFDLVTTRFTEVNFSNSGHLLTSLQSFVSSLLLKWLNKFKNFSFNPPLLSLLKRGFENLAEQGVRHVLCHKNHIRKLWISRQNIKMPYVISQGSGKRNGQKSSC